MIDTHTHLYLPEFDTDREAVVERALNAGVEKMILPNVDLSTIEPMRRLHQQYPESTFMAMGLHPTEVNDSSDEAFAKIMEEFHNHDGGGYVAVGEIGMDLYWDKTFRDKQMEVFDAQCSKAEELDLPIIVHCREALDETLEVLSGHRQLSGVMHSFGGSPYDVERVRNIVDFYFGVNGIATFKNSKLQATVEEITPERLLLETDAPYLAPVPHRGKRNESSFIMATAAHVAQWLGLSMTELDRATTANAHNLFKVL